MAVAELARPGQAKAWQKKRQSIQKDGPSWRDTMIAEGSEKKTKNSETSSRDDLYSADLRERMPSTFRAALHIARQQHFAKKHREAKDSKTDAMLRERQRRRCRCQRRLALPA